MSHIQIARDLSGKISCRLRCRTFARDSLLPCSFRRAEIFGILCAETSVWCLMVFTPAKLAAHILRVALLVSSFLYERSAVPISKVCNPDRT